MYSDYSQASGMIRSLNSDEVKSKSMDQIVWLIGSIAVYVKSTESYRLLRFYDRSVLRIQGSIMGVVGEDDWTAIPYSR